MLMKVVILFINKRWTIWQKLKLLMPKKKNRINILWRFVRLGRPKYKYNKSMHGEMEITINGSQIYLNLYKSIVELVGVGRKRSCLPASYSQCASRSHVASEEVT